MCVCVCVCVCVCMCLYVFVCVATVSYIRMLVVIPSMCLLVMCQYSHM